MTVKQLCADARTIAQELNFIDPNDGEMLRYSDMALQKIAKLLQGVDPRIYGQIAVLNNNEGADDHVYFTGATYTVATKKIAKTSNFTQANPDAAFVVGALTISAVVYNFFARIVSYTADYIILDRDISPGGTITDCTGYVVCYSSSGSPTLSISTQPVSDVVMVTGTNADNIKSVDIDEFLSLTNNPNYDNAAAYCQQGQNLLTYVGSSLTGGLGAVFCFFKRSPRRVTAMTETVDLPIKYHGILRDEIAKTLLVRRGKTPPRELANPLEALEAQMGSIQKGMMLAKEKREARK